MRWRGRRRLTVRGLLVWTLLVAPPVGAEPLQGLCGAPPARSAAQQERLLLLAERVRTVLRQEAVDAAAVLISRSGLDLAPIGHTLSHAGLALPGGAEGGPDWVVRQLYFDCEQGRSRLFDQGLTGFVLGVHRAEAARISLLWWPSGAGRRVADAARDDARGLALLGGAYSANAHAWGTGRQNCNQWLAELLALAESPSAEADPPAVAGDTPSAGPAGRAIAQQALRAQGYEPAELWVPPPLGWLAAASPWLSLADHPPRARWGGRWSVSLPAALEAWVLRRHPAARRVEICLRGPTWVLRRGVEPLDADCEPAPGDEVELLMGGASAAVMESPP